MGKWLNLVVGSIAGGAARYALAGAVYRFLGANFPYGTLAVNLSGCFLIGLFNAWAEVKFLLDPNQRVLLMAGFCGAYTTFSTLILETSNLAANGQFARALLNFFASGLLGFLLFRAGAYVGALA